MQKKLISGLVLLLVLTLLAAGCGGIRQGTRVETAQTFVQALIDGDDETLDAVNRSGPLCQPTFHVMAYTAPRFAGRSLRDFDFVEKGNVVQVLSEDGEIRMGLEIQKVGDKYYFLDFRRVR